MTLLTDVFACRPTPCFLIAEAGVNHDGDLGKAHRLIDASVEAGADCVKFQLFNTDALVSPKAAKADYHRRSADSDDSQSAMLRRLELSPDQHRELKDHCEDKGVSYLCTPCDDASLQALISMDIQALKIASADVTNLPFLERVAHSGVPTILSTGMSQIGEVNDAVDLFTGGTNRLVLLHCTTSYPAPMDSLNLRAIRTMHDFFSLPVGYSDHSASTDVASWAVSLGAVMIEKHITLDRSDPGPDHAASIEPDQFRVMVGKLRQLETALGNGRKTILPPERDLKGVMQKSLVAKTTLRRGAEITRDAVAVMRPATGLPPHWLNEVIGKRAKADIEAGDPITLSMVDWDCNEPSPEPTSRASQTIHE